VADGGALGAGRLANRGRGFREEVRVGEKSMSYSESTEDNLLRESYPNC